MECGVSRGTIGRWMDEHDIERRDLSEVVSKGKSGESPWCNADWLHTQYVVLGKSSREIAEEVGTGKSTILRWLDNHDIEKRGVGDSKGANLDKEYTDERWMKREYVKNCRSTHDIADELDVTNQTIYRWLLIHDIDPRSKQEAGVVRSKNEMAVVVEEDNAKSESDDEKSVKINTAGYSGPMEGIDMSWTDISERDNTTPGVPYHSKEWLEEKYHGDGLDQSEIAEICDCHKTTISHWMDKHGIETRDGPDGAYGDEGWLRKKYHDEGLSTREIADLCDCSRGTISKWMKKHGIEARDSGPNNE